MTAPIPRVVVRCSRIRDVAGISRLLKTCWHHTHDPILGPQRALRVGRRLYSRLNLGLYVAQSRLSPAWTMLVAAHDQLATGFAMAHLDDQSEIVLYMLYVHPDWKGRGIGSALLQGAVTRYPRAKAIRLEVLKDNGAAIAWYQAKGFEIYGETKNATGTVGVAAYYMDKKLDRSEPQNMDAGRSSA